MTGVVPAAARLDVAVATLVGDLSRAQAARLVREGRVTVEGRVVDRPAAKVHPGETLAVDIPPPVPASAQAEALPLRIVYEDADLAVIDKDPGMVVHPAPGHPDGTLVNALLHHLSDLSGIGGETRPGIVHRLDRGTSGLLVVAKHDRAHQHLAAQFARHTAGRTYLALCHGAPREDAGTIESHLARHPRDRLRMASTGTEQGRRAVTHFRVLARAGSVSWLACALETGRTHQVRVHLSEQGHPIVGDGRYARRGTRVPAALRPWVDPSGERPLLHAWQLRLVHPSDGGERCFVAPVPPDLAGALAAVGIDPAPYGQASTSE